MSVKGFPLEHVGLVNWDFGGSRLQKTSEQLEFRLPRQNLRLSIASAMDE